jgi:hypothetical protein
MQARTYRDKPNARDNDNRAPYKFNANASNGETAIPYGQNTHPSLTA